LTNLCRHFTLHSAKIYLCYNFRSSSLLAYLQQTRRNDLQKLLPFTLAYVLLVCAHAQTLPLTARVPPPSPQAATGVSLTDATKPAGLMPFRTTFGTAQKDYILEATGAGCAFLDYDNDGWLDIYLVNGTTLEAINANPKSKIQNPKAALFRNNKNGTFTDVTRAAGVANERFGQGVCVGDFDHDGWADLYVTNFGPNRLYRNNRNGTFTDIAEKAGVALGGWSTGCAFGDYDGDGLLDLFVAGYVKFDLKNLPPPATGKDNPPSAIRDPQSAIICSDAPLVITK
jgi:hypothetical protein